MAKLLVIASGRTLRASVSGIRWPWIGAYNGRVAQNDDVD
jgi:hypothetical protein